MNAKRVNGFKNIQPGEMAYYKTTDGIWYLFLPGCGLGNLAGHTVIEHEDGTISVTPSILVDGFESGEQVTKHGYLTRGVWKDC